MADIFTKIATDATERRRQTYIRYYQILVNIDAMNPDSDEEAELRQLAADLGVSVDRMKEQRADLLALASKIEEAGNVDDAKAAKDAARQNLLKVSAKVQEQHADLNRKHGEAKAAEMRAADILAQARRAAVEVRDADPLMVEALTSNHID